MELPGDNRTAKSTWSAIWRYAWLPDQSIRAEQFARVRTIFLREEKVLSLREKNVPVRRKTCILGFDIAKPARFTCG